MSSRRWTSAQAREAFAEAIRGLDEALQTSAQAAHEALQALAARGKDFSDNDLKNAFAALQKLQQDYVAAANHIADATTGNIRRELVDLDAARAARRRRRQRAHRADDERVRQPHGRLVPRTAPRPGSTQCANTART